MDDTRSCPNDIKGCQFQANSYEEFLDHVRLCGFNIIICTICCQKIPVKDLDNHVFAHYKKQSLEERKNKILFKCPFCQTYGFSKSEMKEHYKTCSNYPRFKMNHSGDAKVENLCSEETVRKALETITEEQLLQTSTKLSHGGIEANTKVRKPESCNGNLEVRVNIPRTKQNHSERINSNTAVYKGSVDTSTTEMAITKQVIMRLEERLDKMEYEFGRRFQTIEGRFEELSERFSNLEIKMNSKGDAIYQKCSLLESNIQALLTECRMHKNSLYNEKEPYSPSSICHQKEQWSQFIHSIFPDKEYTTVKWFRWSLLRFSKKKVKGAVLEEAFSTDDTDYNYRCYLYGSEDGQHFNCRVWVDRNKKPDLLWPPKLSIVLGIFERDSGIVEKLTHFKGMEKAQNYHYINPDVACFYHFLHFISFEALEDSENKFIKDDSINFALCSIR